MLLIILIALYWIISRTRGKLERIEQDSKNSEEQYKKILFEVYPPKEYPEIEEYIPVFTSRERYPKMTDEIKVVMGGRLSIISVLLLFVGIILVGIATYYLFIPIPSYDDNIETASCVQQYTHGEELRLNILANFESIERTNYLILAKMNASSDVLDLVNSSLKTNLISQLITANRMVNGTYPSDETINRWLGMDENKLISELEWVNVTSLNDRAVSREAEWRKSRDNARRWSIICQIAGILLIQFGTILTVLQSMSDKKELMDKLDDLIKNLNRVLKVRKR